MTSPIIPRSISVPDIASSGSPSDVLASTKSVRTTRSTGSPITSWPKKLGDLLKGKTNSDLTEKGLQEFNRRNALIEERYQTSSPYYRGLTNFSLAIQKEKLSGLSPGRESHATSYINSGSKFSFGSWFTPKKHERTYSSSGSSWTKSSIWTRSSNETRFMTSSSSSSSMKVTEKGVAVTKMRIRTTENEIESESKTAALQSKKSENTVISTMEKPLRERDSEPSSMVFQQPTAAPPPEPLPYPMQIPSTDHVFSPLPTPLYNEPSTPPPQILHALPQPLIPASSQLDQFLCNKSTALRLQSLARGWHDITEEFDHFIFEGNPGVGKRTMIWALLREIFGADKVQVHK